MIDDNNKNINKPTPSQMSLSYEHVVKELIEDMKKNKRDLQLIICVFRDQLVKHVKETRLDFIFPHICDLYNFNIAILSALDDVVEMSQEHVGTCFVGTYVSYYNLYISLIYFQKCVRFLTRY